MMVDAAGLVLADGTWGHMDGWSWGWMMGGWLTMLLVVGLVAWALSRQPGASSGQDRPDALDILAARYARGEITAEEYEERRRVLER